MTSSKGTSERPCRTDAMTRASHTENKAHLYTYIIRISPQQVSASHTKKKKAHRGANGSFS